MLSFIVIGKWPAVIPIASLSSVITRDNTIQTNEINGDKSRLGNNKDTTDDMTTNTTTSPPSRNTTGKNESTKELNAKPGQVKLQGKQDGSAVTISDTTFTNKMIENQNDSTTVTYVNTTDKQFSGAANPMGADMNTTFRDRDQKGKDSSVKAASTVVDSDSTLPSSDSLSTVTDTIIKIGLVQPDKDVIFVTTTSTLNNPIEIVDPNRKTGKKDNKIDIPSRPPFPHRLDTSTTPFEDGCSFDFLSTSTVGYTPRHLEIFQPRIDKPRIPSSERELSFDLIHDVSMTGPIVVINLHTIDRFGRVSPSEVKDVEIIIDMLLSSSTEHNLVSYNVAT